MAYSGLLSKEQPSLAAVINHEDPYTMYQADRPSTPHKHSMDDVLNFIGYGPVQLLMFILTSITAMGFGFEMVIFASINIPIQKQMNISEVEFTVLPASTNVANLLGTVVYSLLSDRYGRVWPYLLILLQIAVFGLASGFAQSFTVLVVLRDIVSISVGGTVIVLTPTLLEFLPARNRGKVLISVILVEAVGACVTGGLAWWLIPTFPENGWRYLLIASSIPFFIGALYRVVLYIESPRYLLARSKYKHCRSVLNRMARLNGKKLTDFIPESVCLEDFLHIEKLENLSCTGLLFSWLSIFKKPYLRTTVLLGIIYTTQTVAYYASGIFIPQVLINFNLNPFFTGFVGYLGQIPGIMLMAIIVEWPGVGRLNALRFFSILTTVSFFIFAFVRNIIATSVIIVFVYFSMVPMVPLLLTYASEVYPTEIRSFAVGFFNILSPLVGMGVLFGSSYMTDLSVSLLWLFPTVWGCVFLIQFVLSLFLNRETRGRELEDNVK